MRTLAIAIFSSFCCLCQAQYKNQSTIDSLKNVITSSPSSSEKGHALVILADQYSLTNIDTMPILCYEALELVEASSLPDDDIEKIGLRSVEAEAYNNLGYYHLRKGNLQEAKTHLLKSIEISPTVQYYSNLVSSSINLSLVYAEAGDYKLALDILVRADRFSEAHQFTRERGTILNNIGWIYQSLMEYDGALKYYTRSYEIQKKLDNKSGMASGLNNIGVVQGRLGRLDSAKYYYEAAFEIRKEENSVVGLANSYGNLGHNAYQLGDTLKAEEYYKNCLELCRENDFKRQWLNTLNAYGKLAVAKNDLDLAAQILVEFDTVLPNYNTPVSQREYYQFCYLYQEKLGNFERAYQDYKAYNIIKDSSQMNSMKYELLGRELQIKNETEKALIEQELQHEIDIGKQEERTQRLNFYIVLLILGTVLIFTFFLLRNVRQKQQLTKMQLELSRVKNENLEIDVEQKSKELTSYTLRVAQNNQFIQNVDEIISSVSSASKEDIEDQLRQLKNEINITKRRDKDWVEFQRQFEGIHTSFINNLTTQYPDLTTNEIRLCTLMKLNLPSKDITSILGISMNTIKSSRYRIHKKIGLEEGDKLADFILRFN